MVYGVHISYVRGDFAQKRQFTYEAMGLVTFHTEIRFAAFVSTIVSAPPAYAVRVLTKGAVLGFIACNAFTIAAVFGIPSSSTVALVINRILIVIHSDPVYSQRPEVTDLGLG